ncbi:DJ-1/PfpI family protein [Pollutimonas sp. H1-120]|uniref:DJ-1/PfpI family protein n=1 Tax=Pollutimonas sp. H1-120 TaxID=3148824 RepID=UPI003B525975
MLSLLRAMLGASIAALLLAACEGRAPLPPAPDDIALAQRQKQAFVEALKPSRSGRPVVAVLALNQGTEMTDLLLPHAVLKRADVADVRIVAPRPGRVALYPALRIEGVRDFSGFDRTHPSGADYVIVPAMDPDDDPAVLAWLQGQAQRGARIIGLCSGARVLGRAGLLDGRRFTGHWYDRDTLLDHPGATYVPHQRYMVDRGVATTTGITASVPATLALVEAIAGPDKARAVARDMGVDSWDTRHDSALFGLNAGRAWEYVLNKAAFWRDERWSIEVEDGTDDVALALVADAWSRTGRASIQAASASGPVTLRSGLVLMAQPLAGQSPRLPFPKGLKPVRQLDRALCDIAERYGTARRDWVMQEMEYAGPDPAAPGLACAG